MVSVTANSDGLDGFLFRKLKPETNEDVSVALWLVCAISDGLTQVVVVDKAIPRKVNIPTDVKHEFRLKPIAAILVVTGLILQFGRLGRSSYASSFYFRLEDTSMLCK